MPPNGFSAPARGGDMNKLTVTKLGFVAEVGKVNCS